MGMVIQPSPQDPDPFIKLTRLEGGQSPQPVPSLSKGGFFDLRFIPIPVIEFPKEGGGLYWFISLQGRDGGFPLIPQW
jgi:hypothetical protein